LVLRAVAFVSLLFYFATHGTFGYLPCLYIAVITAITTSCNHAHFGEFYCSPVLVAILTDESYLLVG